MISGYNCQTPEVPKSYQAKYEDWFNTINVLPMDEDTILIGHSAGCGLFLKWLSGNNLKINKLIMVAPWLDPEKEDGDFMQCNLDPHLKSRIKEMHVLHSKDERVGGVNETVSIVMKQYPETSLHTFDNHGHFSLGNNMNTAAFPELLDIIIK